MTARPHLFALAAIVVAGLLAALGVRSAVVLDLVFTLLLYAVLGQSWNWISGYAGNISFGHAIFFGCGAYASALCVTHGLSPWLAIPAGALAAALLALVTGFPTLGLRGHYFSIATIALERSRLGYYLRALRANHAAAASVGIDERRYKLIAFAWSAAMAAAAGVLYAQYTLFVDPPSTIVPTIPYGRSAAITQMIAP